MEKLRLEVSTRSASANITPCICAVCGLVLSTQLPIFAVEVAPQKLRPTAKSAPVPARTATGSEHVLRPMAFRRTTTARSQAKSQVARAQSTPLQSLKPTASAKTVRFALTTPAAPRTNAINDISLETDFPANSPKWATAPDERIVMTALPAPEKPSPKQNILTPQDLTPQPDIQDSVTIREAAAAQKRADQAGETARNEQSTNGRAVIQPVAATGKDSSDSESEPLTGTIDIPQKPIAPATAPPAKTSAGSSTDSSVGSSVTSSAGAGVSVPNSTKADTANSTVVTADSKIAQTSRLFAPSIAYDGGTIIAEGTAENPVRLEGTGTRIIARKVRLDTTKKTVSAEGSVRVERQVAAKVFSTTGGSGGGGGKSTQSITETLQGESFEYNYETRQGKLGATTVRLANFNISAEQIIINGTKYIAHNVVIRLGGQSEEDIRIYGKSPFSIHAKDAIVDTSKPAPPNKTSADTPDDTQTGGPATARTQVHGANLYFKNFRILPIPSALLGRTLGGPREQETYQLTPRIAFSSTDGVLATVGLKYPFSPLDPDRLTLTTDIGISTKVGFRGGFTFDTNNNLGRFAIGARLNDVISSQLTNRIELDRLPEFGYEAPKIALFALPGGRRAGLRFDLTAGDYRERFTTGDRIVSGSRVQGQLRFSTRMSKRTGPYLDLAARAARYSRDSSNLNTMGFEVGYAGSLGSRLTGQFSYGATKVNGSTPFEFDKVAIRQELRATFDLLLTPRYIIPIDLRYDLDRQKLRERTFGILRNYKTFAYGLTYQSSRQELQFQVRQGF